MLAITAVVGGGAQAGAGVVVVPPRLLELLVELEGGGRVDIEKVGDGADAGRLLVAGSGNGERGFHFR